MDFGIEIDATPLRLRVDPRFDVFRRLDSSELPASLDELFSRQETLALIPRDIDEQRRAAYRGLALELGATTIIEDHDVDVLPTEKAVWLLGWENRFLDTLESLLKHPPGSLTAQHATIGSQVLSRDEYCVVAVARHTTTANPIAWVGCDSSVLANSLGTRLLHYGKYSYLGFDAKTARNAVKGHWAVSDSVLSVVLGETGDVPALEIPKAAPLSEHLLTP